MSIVPFGSGIQVELETNETCPPLKALGDALGVTLGESWRIYFPPNETGFGAMWWEKSWRGVELAVEAWNTGGHAALSERYLNGYPI